MMRDPGDYFQDVINVVFRWKEDSSKLFIQFEQKIQAYGNRIQELETMNASLKETAAVSTIPSYSVERCRCHL